MLKMCYPPTHKSSIINIFKTAVQFRANKDERILKYHIHLLKYVALRVFLGQTVYENYFNTLFKNVTEKLCW